MYFTAVYRTSYWCTAQLYIVRRTGLLYSCISYVVLVYYTAVYRISYCVLYSCIPYVVRVYDINAVHILKKDTVKCIPYTVRRTMYGVPTAYRVQFINSK